MLPIVLGNYASLFSILTQQYQPVGCNGVAYHVSVRVAFIQSADPRGLCAAGICPAVFDPAEAVADEEACGLRKQKLSSIWDDAQTHQPHNYSQIITSAVLTYLERPLGRTWRKILTSPPGKPLALSV